jgi:hypothetical protein
MKKALLLALVGVTTGCGDGLVVTDVPVTCYYEGGLPIIFEPTDGAFLSAVTVLMAGRALRDGWVVWTPGGLEATMIDGDEVLKFWVAFDVGSGEMNDELSFGDTGGRSRTHPAMCEKDFPTGFDLINQVLPGTFR